MRSALPLLAVLPLIASAACATAGPPADGGPTVGAPADGDPTAVRPEDLAAPDVRALQQAAFEAYAAEDWATAAEKLIALARAQPGNPIHLYNVACAFGRLERPEQSARFLEAAWEAGFHDVERIREDADLDPVRDDPAFVAVVQGLAAQAARRERELGIPIPVVAEAALDARVVLPQGPAPEAGWPVVVALHGFGHSAEGLAELLAVDDARALWVFPQGPYDAGPGFSWFRIRQGDMTPLQPSRDLAEAYVLKALEVVRDHWPVDPDRIVVTGFSQGGLLAFSLGLRHPDLFAASVGVGGWIDPAEQPLDVRKRAASAGLRVVVLHSPEDESVDFARAEASAQLLRDADVPFEFERYPGGHVIPPNLVERVREVVRETAGGRPAS